MNIHPAFVHFPIAFLFVYALIELLPVGRLYAPLAPLALKRFLLSLGTLGALASVVTGTMAEELVDESKKPFIEAHEEVALTLLAVSVALTLIVYLWKGESRSKVVITKVLALSLLVLLVLVGALGANIVYGSNADPIVTIVARLFEVVH